MRTLFTGHSSNYRPESIGREMKRKPEGRRGRVTRYVMQMPQNPPRRRGIRKNLSARSPPSGCRDGGVGVKSIARFSLRNHSARRTRPGFRTLLPLQQIRNRSIDGAGFGLSLAREIAHARDLQTLLGYTKWNNCLNVVAKAKTACEASGHQAVDHFADAGKMIQMPKSAVGVSDSDTK
jgi:hypothetical protein